MSTMVHWRRQTQDPCVADQIVRETYATSSLTQRSRFGRFSHELDGDAEVGISRMSLGGSFTGAGCLETQVLIVLPIAGDYAWGSGDELGCGRHPVLRQPEVAAFSRSIDVDLRRAVFDEEALERLAADAFGTSEGRLVFDGATPVSPELERLWIATLRLASDVFRDPALDEMPMVHATARRHLAVVALEAFRLVGDVDRRPASFSARDRVSRRANAYVDDHAHEPITPEDVSRDAGMTTAALDDALRSTSSKTTADVIRRARVRSAHVELTLADAAQTSVAIVARNWGYRDPAVFARDYRDAYGLPPSHTLRS